MQALPYPSLTATCPLMRHSVTGCPLGSAGRAAGSRAVCLRSSAHCTLPCAAMRLPVRGWWGGANPSVDLSCQHTKLIGQAAAALLPPLPQLQPPQLAAAVTATVLPALSAASSAGSIGAGRRLLLADMLRRPERELSIMWVNCEGWGGAAKVAA